MLFYYLFFKFICWCFSTSSKLIFRRAARWSTLATIEDGGNAWAKSTYACCCANCASSLSRRISSVRCAYSSVLNGVANGVIACAGVSIRKRSGDVIGDSV